MKYITGGDIMNAEIAACHIYNYARTGGCSHSTYLEAREYLRSLEPAPKWLRHEGGEMPDGVGQQMVICVYDTDLLLYSEYFGRGWKMDWNRPLWYYVIPDPPAPPKAKRWRAEWGERYWAISSSLQATWYYDHRNGRDDAAYELGNYFRTQAEAEAARPAILAAFNKLQGGDR